MKEKQFKDQYFDKGYGSHIPHELLDEQKNIDEAIFQLQSCISSLKYQRNNATINNAQEVLQVIHKNLDLEKSKELKALWHILQEDLNQ